MAKKKRILRTPDAAAYLDLSTSTLEKRRRAGLGPKTVKLSGRRVGYDVRDLDEFIDQQRTPQPEPPGRAA